MDDQTTVFVVDEDADVREAVGNLALTMNLGCELYTSGEEFLACHDRTKIGCVVLELKVPGISGLQIQERLLQEGSPLSIIFLSGHGDISIAVEAMRSGAVHFLQKPFRAHELWGAIHEAVQRSRQQHRAKAWRENIESQMALLTPKERHVLDMLGAGMENQEMASELGVSLRTIEAHRANLKKKLKSVRLDRPLHLDILARHVSGWQATREEALWLGD